jgi:hypothetical protein
MTPGIASTVALSTTEASLSSKRSLVAQCVKLMMFSGPPTAARIASGAEVVVVIEGLSSVLDPPATPRGPGARVGTVPRRWD